MVRSWTCPVSEHAGQPGRDPARGGQQYRTAAAAEVQRGDQGGAAVRRTEPVWEAAQRVHVRAAERVDRLIRIAHRDQLPAVARELHQQLLLRRIGVLVLVREHRVVRVSLARADRAAPQQRSRDPDDLGVVVGGDWREIEARRVGIEEPPGGRPIVASVQRAERGQPAAVETALGRPEQEVAQLRGESPGTNRGAQPLGPAAAAVARLAAQQPPDFEQLLRPGKQNRRLLAAEHELPSDQRERVAVKGHGQRLPQGAVQPQRDALAQLLGGLAAERQHQHPAGVDAPARYPVDNGLDDRRGLAGTRTGEHEQRSAAVRNDGPLRSVQRRRG